MPLYLWPFIWSGVCYLGSGDIKTSALVFIGSFTMWVMCNWQGYIKP
jgi:hypothetical protein